MIRDSFGDVVVLKPPGRRDARSVEQGVERVGGLSLSERLEIDRDVFGLEPTAESELALAAAVIDHESTRSEGDRMIVADDLEGDPLLSQDRLQSWGRFPEQERQARQRPR